MDHFQMKHPRKPDVCEHDSQATYQVGKTTVFVTRIFQTKNAETLAEILVKLIYNDLEKP